MPALRTKSVSTKVTDEEYAQLEALAGEQTISEWARDVLLKAAKPNSGEQVILAEVVALRTILLNALYKLGQKEGLSAEEMQELIERADRVQALREARRILKRGGVLFAAAVSRFASLLDGLSTGGFRDPQFKGGDPLIENRSDTTS